MNTRIKPTAKVRILMTSLIASAACMVSTSSWSNDQCVRGTLVSDVELLSPFGPGVGVAYADIAGQILPIITYGDIVSSKVQGDGSIHLVVEENDSTPDGSTIQIRDKVILTPTDIPGEFTLKIHSKMLGGTGLFSDVDGKYSGEGTASFNTTPAQLHHTGEAKMCGLPF